MFQGLTIGVVVPAHNEARHIVATLAGMPEFVDRVIVIDDASTDATSSLVRQLVDPRIHLIRRRVNCGVGGAILMGYKECLLQRLDVAVVMAGDGQMDPLDLPALLAPIAQGWADYVKGNRFAHPQVWRQMPPLRLIGNLALSLMTRPVAGYRSIIDSQSGYTAATSQLLEKIQFAQVYPRYGFPNDFLAHAHSAGARVVQVPVRPIYADEASGIRTVRAILPLTYVLGRAFITRKLREAGRTTNTSSTKVQKSATLIPSPAVRSRLAGHRQ